MNNSAIRDNHKNGTVGDFLIEHIKNNSSASIVSAYFTIYAYKKLQAQLDSINKLRFLFGEPTFIKTIDPKKMNSHSYQIEDNQLTIPIANRLSQKATARECSDWIKANVDIRSMVKPNFLHGKMYYIEQESGIQKSNLREFKLYRKRPWPWGKPEY